jgi:hypothetical protein
MKKRVLHTSILMIMSIDLYAGEDILPVEPQLNIPSVNIKSESESFIKTMNGYIRVGYQQDDNSNSDLSLGGKLHIETNVLSGINVGASFYTSTQLGQNDGAGVPFFDTNNHSYSILGEAYIQGQWGNTILKIGRQEIDTPYADTDDVGMVPNTFEAAVLINKDIKDTTLFLAQLQKWSGVDSDKVDRFTKLNNNGVQVLGITYEGIKNTTFSGWFYHIQNNVNIAYLDASYEGENNTLTYSLTSQYSLQDYKDNTRSTIYGIGGSLGLKNSGFTASIAYNNVNGKAADNFFGGGPYVTNAEHHTLSEAGRNGNAILYSLEWDTSSAGLNGLVLSFNIDNHSNGSKDDTNEYDLVANYEYNENLNFTAIYSDIDDTTCSFKNLRVFMNYTF